MKTNSTQYGLFALVTAVAVVGMSFAAFSSAQAIVPVACSTATPTVNVNQAATFTATGGNGIFAWSGTNLNVTNAVGSQFAVSYPTAGTYTLTVTSAGLTANCTLNVVAGGTAGALACSPAAQSVILGQTATFAATGGTGSYTWTSPDITISNATGSGFSANFASTGLKSLTVSSGGVSSTCVINVLSNGGTVPPVIPPVVPGLPNTGEAYGA